MEQELTLDLEALETSFDHVAPRGDELMDVFYTRLFEASEWTYSALLDELIRLALERHERRSALEY